MILAVVRAFFLRQNLPTKTLITKEHLALETWRQNTMRAATQLARPEQHARRRTQFSHSFSSIHIDKLVETEQHMAELRECFLCRSRIHPKAAAL